MRLGLYFPFQLPRPWGPDSEGRLFDEALDQVALADQLGIDYAWVPEQHFTEEYSHSSAPEIFLAAASQRTTRIRLGHGIALLPPAYNDPVRVAERTAALDLVSGGRVEFGVGDSKSRIELEGFGIDPDQRREMTREALAEIVRMWIETPYRGAAGAHVSVPARNIVPKPRRRPHPPLWMACSDDETVARAARLGLGALTHSFYNTDEAERVADLYFETFRRECVPIGVSVNPQIAMLNPFYCHQETAVARQRGLDAAGFMGFAVRHYYSFGRHEPGHTDLWRRYERVREEFGGVVPLRGTHAVGSPEEILEHLRAFAAVGIDQAILAHQGGRLTHEEICESLRLLAREVMPSMRFLRQEQRKRREALQPFIDAALARRAAADRAPVEVPFVDAYGRTRPAIDAGKLPPAVREQVEDLQRMATVARSFES
ncbi:LLM class flavin-dependent oxidoreductase [Sphaerisporangium sp. NPDC051011]|uniref:LLM class flavin-dependent oxidoreductase n=1 Tax=Sphaerisporangium sp. NPDC051011 TaxID=3155792 RepID=UPI0033FBE063